MGFSSMIDVLLKKGFCGLVKSWFMTWYSLPEKMKTTFFRLCTMVRNHASQFFSLYDKICWNSSMAIILVNSWSSSRENKLLISVFTSSVLLMSNDTFMLPLSWSKLRLGLIDWIKLHIFFPTELFWGMALIIAVARIFKKSDKLSVCRISR
jgi:hypothetical protein